MNNDVIYLEGIGWVKEIVINRLNESGVSESYVEYEIVNR